MTSAGPSWSETNAGVGCTTRDGTSKRYYRTKAEAKRIARSVQRRGFGKRRPYLCPTCGGYHLTTDER